jgi:endonuclease-3 related protein
MLLGAILVQNTAWRNVESAMQRLRAEQVLDLEAARSLPRARLESLIRPAGTYRIKARRILAMLEFLHRAGGVQGLAGWSSQALREGLLSVHGIGPETADAMLVYGFGRPVFVVDRSLRRLLARLDRVHGARMATAGYEALRGELEHALRGHMQHFGEYHALVVEHGKQHCAARPRCAGCPLARHCDGVTVAPARGGHGA